MRLSAKTWNNTGIPMASKNSASVLPSPNGSSRARTPSGSSHFTVSCLWALFRSLLYVYLSFLFLLWYLNASQGRWWFGSRGLTKDGVHGSTASLFFKAVTDDASIDDLVSLLSRGFSIEDKAAPRKVVHSTTVEDDLNGLETEIKVTLSARWATVAKVSLRLN